MNLEQLKSLNKEQVLDFIRDRLAFKEVEQNLRYVNTDEFKKEHRRFDMSGYESKTGASTLHTLSIINEFADLGIYDYTNYLFLDFYKGTPTLYLQYFHQSEHKQYDLTGHGTIEILYKIFEFTIFSGQKQRRR